MKAMQYAPLHSHPSHNQTPQVLSTEIVLGPHELLRSSSKRIYPSSKSVSTLRKLHFDNRLRPGIVTPTQLLPRLIHFQYILAIIRVPIPRPRQRACRLRSSPVTHFNMEPWPTF